MPHLSSATTTMTNATIYKLSSPIQDNNLTPIELAPILNTCNSLDNRPPSPDSPKTKKLLVSSASSSFPSCSTAKLPSFLEPTPQIELYQHCFSLDLLKNIPSSFNVNTTTTTTTTPANELSPRNVMSSSSAAAAAAADTTPNSPVVLNLLKSIGDPIKEPVATATTVVDQSIFLTKTAHIKRPRNAWIHFRCHYGQALKSKDPTLRAEEISKRASERWSKLTQVEKKPWHGLAEQEKLAHRVAFPEYRYCPRRTRQSSTDSCKKMKHT